MIEINIDTLPGPTHAFSGIAHGNIPSFTSKGMPSNPKQAALQCLEKMKYLMDLGIPQVVLPPQFKPNKAFLKTLTGSTSLRQIKRLDPKIQSALFSSANMWTANAATVSPSCDSPDGKVHITPANLASHLHRFIDVPGTVALLKKLFGNTKHFVVHEPLPPTLELHDEGAANHTRFSNGLHLFVYGREELKPITKRFFPRQPKLASQQIAARHGLTNVLFAQQNPKAIDAGVFHNDVISTGHEDLFLVHEMAFVNQQELLTQLKDIQIIEITDEELPLKEAVATYLFNSQIVTCPETNHKVVFAPFECTHSEKAMSVLKRLELDPKTNIREIVFIHLDQSMRNGGGPACLRLRIPLTRQEIDALPKSFLLTNALYHDLKSAIEALYPTQFSPETVTSDTLRTLESTTRAIQILLGC